MTPSQQCYDLIKECEGWRSAPYLDVAGIPTIGYGFTHYGDGRKVTMDDAPITEDQGQEILVRIVEPTADQVSNIIQVEVSQNQFDALVDFAYNLGVNALKGSTLLKLLNEDKPELASDEFHKWVYAGGRVVQGLVNRRTKEYLLFRGLS
jgi:lysozyme